MTGLLAAVCFSAKAQTWAEIFKQKKTQTKYATTQILGLQLYLEYARKGYELVDGGLNLVRDFSSGEFSLHEAFFKSLSSVSPVVRNHVKVAEIISMQLEIINGFGSILRLEGLPPPQEAYILQVKAVVLAESLSDLEVLYALLNPAGLKLTVAERIRRLEALHESVSEKAGFVRHFAAQVRGLLSARQQEELNRKQIKKLYEIN